jgi:CubicO group peptidase (beta-lactamase class C family)
MIRTATLVLALGALLAAPIMAQPLPVAAPEEVGLSSERLARVGDVFEGYVEEGRIAGAVGMVARKGRLVYADQWGMRDVAAGDALEADDIFRIFSMSKPITSVAVMMLFEEGHFMLTDPVGRYLPELGSVEVAVLGEGAASSDDIPTERAQRPITIQDLLRHTSGLTYGVFSNTAVDQAYRAQGALSVPTIEEMVAVLGGIPLMYQPGERWNYSLSTDVLGRLVEVVSGQPFDVFLRERIFEPLGMEDTGFSVPALDRHRLSRPYGHTGPTRSLALGDTTGYDESVTRFSGGGGLVGTAADYLRFAQMLLNGGELEGVRILSPTSIELMTLDHLADRPSGWLSPGWGFGLGFAVRKEAGLDGMPGSVGEYYWFGVAGTSFWVDPVEELIGVFMIQINPSRDLAFRNQFKNLVYQAVIH